MQAVEGAAVTQPNIPHLSVDDILAVITECLDDHKAEDIAVINLAGKSSIADYLVIASGRSQRQVAALADYVEKRLKSIGERCRIEGLPQADWVLLDAGDIVVHLFRPEVRHFYNLDKMWSVDLSLDPPVN